MAHHQIIEIIIGHQHQQQTGATGNAPQMTTAYPIGSQAGGKKWGVRWQSGQVLRTLANVSVFGDQSILQRYENGHSSGNRGSTKTKEALV